VILTRCHARAQRDSFSLSRRGSRRAQNADGQSSAIDGHTTRHKGAMGSASASASGSREGFGWIKTVAGQEKTKFRGCWRIGLAFTFAVATYNLIPLAVACSGSRDMLAGGIGEDVLG
jgi:hypothetical protein